MYSRNIDGGDLTFAVSGKLWHGVLVMFDRETETLWTQLDGRAIDGELQGTRLEYVPSVFTTWSEWRAAHPDTKVLVKSEEDRERKESNYADYFADPDRLFMERLGEGIHGIGAKETIWGVQLGDKWIALPDSVLDDDQSVAVSVGEQTITWHREPETAQVLASVDTGGAAEALRVDRAFWYAWSRSHPGSLLVEIKDEGSAGLVWPVGE